MTATEVGIRVSSGRSSIIEIGVRTIGIALALFCLNGLLGLIFPHDPPLDVYSPAVNVGLSFLSCLLLTAPLAWPVHVSKLDGLPLFAAVFLAVFGLSTILTQIEAVVFLDMKTTDLVTGGLRQLLLSLALAGLATRYYPRRAVNAMPSTQRPNPPTMGSWLRRLLLVAIVYLVLYICAGLLIIDIVEPWYEAQGALDFNPTHIVVLQLARGLLFAGCVIPLLRSMHTRRLSAALSLAFLIPMIHGLAALVVPSPFMPSIVRYAHMMEIGWSNFVLGLLIGFLFWKPTDNGKWNHGAG